MDVDDYVEHDQYWEEQCARQAMRIEDLEHQHAQMLEALERLDAWYFKYRVGLTGGEIENWNMVKAAISAAKEQ